MIFIYDEISFILSDSVKEISGIIGIIGLMDWICYHSDSTAVEESYCHNSITKPI
jgi:hypothetical protein